jgi:hypothetical protein
MKHNETAALRHGYIWPFYMPKFQKLNAVTKVVNRKFMLKLEWLGILDLTIF